MAYGLVLSTEYPSWGFSIVNGATTIWERWNSYTPENGFGDVGMNSFNHYSLGSVVEWMYEYVLGIRPLEPGFKKIAITPVYDPLGRISYASGTYDSESGTITVDWEMNGDIVTLNVTKPAEVEAFFDIKGEIIRLGADGEAAKADMLPFASEISVQYRIKR